MWNRLMLTAAGKTLYAKAQQGKQLTFTRVGIGEGAVGSGSLVNRTALISETQSLLIDAIQIVNENESAIIATLKNDELNSGYYFREIGIFAKDPDTQAEQLYLYDNAGADGEYIPDKNSGVQVAERLKFLLLLENVSTVSFVASGNPIYLTAEDIDDTATATGLLWSSSKTAAQIAAAEAAAKAASRPSTWTPSATDVGAVPANMRGVAGGVAELDSDGYLPESRIPNIDCGSWDNTQNEVAIHNASATAHQDMQVDGVSELAADDSSTLLAHITAAQAHQNIEIDGNTVL